MGVFATSAFVLIGLGVVLNVIALSTDNWIKTRGEASYHSGIWRSCGPTACTRLKCDPGASVECDKLNTVRAGMILGLLLGVAALVMAAYHAFRGLSDSMRNLMIGLAAFAGFWMLVAWAVYVDLYKNASGTSWDWGFVLAILSFLAFWLAVPAAWISKTA